MCTIVALKGVRADLPLVLATNRDEFFARPSSGPTRLLDQPLTLGGRDLVAGGTWMGVTKMGLFVGVTNQRTFAPPDPTRRSRGQLVLGALALGDVGAITSLVQGIDGRDYNGCNLMWGDARALYVGYLRAQARIEIVEVADGVHVLPNDRLDSADFPKVARAQALIAPLVSAPFEALVHGLERVLADDRLPALDEIASPPPASEVSRERLRQLAALCVRTESYGTRTSTVVAIGPEGTRYFGYADGPPDRTPFVDIRAMYDQA
ncbi:MAG: NRDE family protein [Polyangiales bacterium]